MVLAGLVGLFKHEAAHALNIKQLLIFMHVARNGFI